MGVFDTYIIPCPYCNSLIEDQRKPGSMNTYRFGVNPETDLEFAGFYTCDVCKENFTIEAESVPKMIFKRVDK